MSASAESIELTHIAASAATDKKATFIQALDVSERFAISDVFLIASGSAEPQVKAIVDEIEDKLSEAGATLLRREGMNAELRWVLLDYGELIVHVQRDEDCDEYALARLWGDCPVIDLQLDGEV